MQYKTTHLNTLKEMVVAIGVINFINAWKLKVLVIKRLRRHILLNCSFELNWQLIAYTRRTKTYGRRKSYSGRDPGDDMRMDGLPHVADITML